MWLKTKQEKKKKKTLLDKPAVQKKEEMHLVREIQII